MVLTVQQLSDGVLLKFFDWLDAKSLKNAALVCKRCKCECLKGVCGN